MQDESTGFGDVLIDVSGLSLRDLNEVDETVISHALRRVLGEEDEGPVAGFSSRI